MGAALGSLSGSKVELGGEGAWPGELGPGEAEGRLIFAAAALADLGGAKNSLIGVPLHFLAWQKTR